MKKTKHTGLQAGIYRENTKKDEVFALSSSVLIFLALAAIFHTAANFSAILPLFGAGVLTCVVIALVRHFKKAKWLAPTLFIVALIAILLARAPLLRGFCATWNDLRDLWAAEKGILLPLAETDGSGLWLAGIVLGVLLALVSFALSNVPALAAILLAGLSVAAAFVQPSVILLFAAGISVLLLSWQKEKNTVSAASFVLVGAIVVGIAALAMQNGTMQSLSQSAKDCLHHWRFEPAEELLPEGDLTQPVKASDSTDAILTVTSGESQTLYLRGFVGDSYENETWTSLDAKTAAEEKDLFYWVGMARLIRGQILSIKENEYVLAARSIGAKPGWIIRKHILPNCLSVIIVSTALQIPSAIFTESYLSFIGLGVNAPMPSLGSLANSGRQGLQTYPYKLIFPALMICLIVLSLNLLGDGLRDAFDPKLKR